VCGGGGGTDIIEGHFADKAVGLTDINVSSKRGNEMLVLAETHTHTHAHAHTQHCITIHSSEENSHVFTFLYNIHCTHSEDEGDWVSTRLDMKRTKLQVPLLLGAK